MDSEGKFSFKNSIVFCVKRAISRSCFSIASAAMMPGPPAFVTIDTLFPDGKVFVLEKAKAKSNSSFMVRARMIPVYSNAIS